MSRLRPLVAGALIAAAGLIGVNGVAYAATGSNFILGHSNYANKVTTITRTTAGPALSLRVKKYQVPFTVSSKIQVAKLNATYVGGLSATSLQTRALEYTLPGSTIPTGGATYTLAGLPVGTYDASFDVVASMTTSGAEIGCVLEHADYTEQLLDYGSTYLDFSTATASGVVTITAGHPLHLRCFTRSTYVINSSTRSVVDFVRIDGVTVHGATTAATARGRDTAHPDASGR